MVSASRPSASRSSTASSTSSWRGLGPFAASVSAAARICRSSLDPGTGRIRSLRALPYRTVRYGETITACRDRSCKGKVRIAPRPSRALDCWRKEMGLEAALVQVVADIALIVDAVGPGNWQGASWAVRLGAPTRRTRGWDNAAMRLSQCHNFHDFRGARPAAPAGADFQLHRRRGGRRGHLSPQHGKLRTCDLVPNILRGVAAWTSR